MHPGAWWLWAIALVAAASRTANPVVLLTIAAVTFFVFSARRADTPWAASYALFFRLALLVIALHVVFQALLSTRTQGLTVLFTLPQLPLPAGTGLKIGGVVTLEAVLAALWHGLQLATIFCCIGAANALGSARRLLRSVPAALYEVGIACVIALTFAPQLATDAARVRTAGRMRGAPVRRGPAGLAERVRRFGRLAMPVLEGALERSVDLAAAMDSRGYGRTTGESVRARRATSALVLGGSIGLLAGVYGLLTAHGYGAPLLLGGSALAVAGLWLGGRRSGRSRYRPDPWALPELLVVACGLVAAGAVFWTGATSPELLTLASPTALPPVPLVALAGILVAALPAVLAPPPPEAAAPPLTPRAQTAGAAA
nr:energy-coupling factor transporter transmembrane component T [Nocardioides perillae]